MSLPLTIGGVRFYDLEVPETIGPFGGRQVLVVHEYPGGAKDIDSLGAFPHTVEWSGMFSRTFAFARAQQLDRIRTVGDPVLLTYGPQQYLGKVAHFDYKPKHQFLIPYKITFEPIADLSGVGVIAVGLLSLEAMLAAQMDAMTSVMQGDDGLLLPAALLLPSGALLTAARLGLLNGNGTVAGIPAAYAAGIALSAAAVQVAAAPLIISQDPTVSSPAFDLLARSIAINTIARTPRTGVRIVRTVNPNLFVMAAQYLGDALRWQDIATASGLTDPQPIGEYIITVPAS